jgi:hypothetical protein
LDKSSREHLPIMFDGSPAEDDFPYWRNLLRLAEQ